MKIKLYTREEYAKRQGAQADPVEMTPSAAEQSAARPGAMKIKLYSRDEYLKMQPQSADDQPRREDTSDYAVTQDELLRGARDAQSEVRSYRTRMNNLTPTEASAYARASEQHRLYSDAAAQAKQAERNAVWERTAKQNEDNASGLMLRAPTLAADKNADAYRNPDYVYSRFGGIFRTREDDAVNAMTDAERSTLAAYDTSGQHDKAQEYHSPLPCRAHGLS